MESLKYYQNLNISEMDFLSDDIRALLREYNIFTLGQLLSATKGLTNLRFFQDSRQRDAFYQPMLDQIPIEVIDFYRNFSDIHPTGLIKNNQDENPK